MNDGVDWTTDNVPFIFYPQPLMTKLNKYTTNLKGNVSIIITGINFRNDITFCLFGEKVVAPNSVSPT